jgi:hypothetical protein
LGNNEKFAFDDAKRETYCEVKIFIKQKMTAQYQRQLNYIFNRPTTDPEWYWSNDDWEEGIFDETAMSSFVFIETLLLNAKTDLMPYADDQIGMGLNYIFNSACSNLADDFKAVDVPFERKSKAIHALFDLFQGVLNARCQPILSAFSQAPLSKIQYICYMFWDTCSWSIWTNENSDDYYKTIATVMKRCLDLDNPACVESGLHGLGHLALNHPQIAVPIIDNFLQNTKNTNENLINYAKMARTGSIL